jgi:hypothetical protein
VHDPETRPALQFDTLAAVVPMERRCRLEQLLIDDGIATQKHLARKDDENTPRPASQGLVSKFVGAPSLGIRPSVAAALLRQAELSRSDGTRAPSAG